MKQGKLYSKKEKTAALLVSTALVGAPFIVGGSYVSYAYGTETLPSPKPVTIVDEISNLVVPLHEEEIAIRDLKAIYGNYITNVSVTSTNSNSSGSDIAYNEQGYGSAGLLKIHPLRVGNCNVYDFF
ncbi:hypothetical protein [Paenibacillus roseipurpureus]|uniref:Uncharacterized protein n=1 Tax=Paenibacillus roseopurpureus TaxID=2918901 RepID=A0AA96LJQ8_9BACL|nr:hypothetical protein [Paenibacillus sp. MBLB1832]WNR43157.1 hypothetical protein MJB10_18840 [Paenibacillus sp. MBLB1832]